MHIVLLKCPHVQIAFLKITSCDNQALVGCIPIAAVAVHLKREIIKIGQSSHKMYSNNIVNFQESMTILNSCTKKSGDLLNAPHICIYILIHFVNIYVCMYVWKYILYKDKKKKNSLSWYHYKFISGSYKFL